MRLYCRLDRILKQFPRILAYCDPRQYKGMHRFGTGWWIRARLGFAPQDCWSLDSYLNAMLPNAIRYLRDHICTYPSYFVNGDSMSFEQWCEILTTIADGLEAGQSADEDFACKTDARYQQHRKALELLTDYWWHLWD